MTDKWLDTAAKVVTRAADDLQAANDAAHKRECNNGWRHGIPCKECNKGIYDDYMSGDAMHKDMMRYYRTHPNGNWSGD